MSGIIQQLNNFGISQDLLIKSAFYLISGLTIFFALRIVISRNIFHSAIFFAMALIGVACVYLFLDAEFLAIIQILVYVGAISVLFVFAVMLTANIQDRAIKQVNQQVIISAIASIAIFLLIVLFVIKRHSWQTANQNSAPASLVELGKSFLTTYALPFEIISLILLMALVGAVVISKIDKK